MLFVKDVQQNPKLPIDSILPGCLLSPASRKPGAVPLGTRKLAGSALIVFFCLFREATQLKTVAAAVEVIRIEIIGAQCDV